MEEGVSKFVNKALEDLTKIFVRICDKRSCTASDKTNFMDITRKISETCERYEELTVNCEISSLTSSAVLTGLTDLGKQFSQLSERFDTMEHKIDKLMPSPMSMQTSANIEQVSTYAAVTASGTLPDKARSSSSNNVFPKIYNDTGKSYQAANNPNRNRLVISGSNKNSGLKTVSKLPRRKALFVSRLSPETSEEVINESLNFLHLDYLKCRRLKSRFPSYASFHIETYEKDFEKLLDECVWPEGCIVSEFRGRLRNDQVCNVYDSVSVGSPRVPSAVPGNSDSER